jgi:hypothetical protein
MTGVMERTVRKGEVLEVSDSLCWAENWGIALTVSDCP